MKPKVKMSVFTGFKYRLSSAVKQSRTCFSVSQNFEPPRLKLPPLIHHSNSGMANSPSINQNSP